MTFGYRRPKSWRAICLGLTLVCLPALAETPGAAAAEVLFRDGRESMKKGDFKVAKENFAESYRLDPSIGTLLNLALCEEKTGHLTGAWLHLRELLEKASEHDERRPLARRRLAELERRIPHVTIVQSTGRPLPASIRLDGTPIGRVSIGVPLPVDPGEHKLVVANGHGIERSETISLLEGQSIVAIAEASSEGSTVPPLAEGSPSTHGEGATVPLHRGSSSRRTTGIIFAGAGVATLVASVFPTLAMLRREAERDEHCGANGCDDRAFEATREARTWNVVATGTAVTGLLSLGIGTYLLLSGGPSKERSRGSTPQATAVTAGLAVDRGASIAVTVNF